MRYQVKERAGLADAYFHLLATDDLSEAWALFNKVIENGLPPESDLVLEDTVKGTEIMKGHPDATPAAPAEVKTHALAAWQCAPCDYEFVIVSLAGKQAFDGPPFCPCCGDDDGVHKIDCLDFTLLEKVCEYEVTKSVKPLPS